MKGEEEEEDEQKQRLEGEAGNKGQWENEKKRILKLNKPKACEVWTQRFWPHAAINK